MKYDEVMQMVLDNPFENWIYFDAYGEYTLKSDVNLHIVRCNFESKTSFYESWAIKDNDPNAFMYTYTIFYCNSRIDEFCLVAVDGYKAFIPMPQLNSTTISKQNYLLALAVDNIGSLDEYITDSALTVEK